MANETNVPTAKPTTLEGWVKLLDGVRLPVPQESHDRVCKAIRDNRSSLRDIANLMQDSPALALSVIREANRHTQGSMSETAENLEVAINRLGLTRTEELLARLPAVPQAQIPVALRQLQLISQHATQQANGFFASRLARLWQDIHWGSLLFLSPLWPLALTHPKLLEEWELRVIHKGESAYTVEKQLFGVRLLQICQTLVDIWRLPIWVQQGYRLLLTEQRELVKVLRIARDSEHPLRQQNRLDDDPTLRNWLNQPANTVLLANGLALSAQQAWNCPHSQRWQYLTSLYLQMPMDEVQQQLHQQAANSARQHAMPDLWHPAISLLWPWGQNRPAARTGADHRRPVPVAQAMCRIAGGAESLHQRHAPDQFGTRCTGRLRHAAGDDPDGRPHARQPASASNGRAAQRGSRPEFCGQPKSGIATLARTAGPGSPDPDQQRPILRTAARQPAFAVSWRASAAALTGQQWPGNNGGRGRSGRRAVLGNHRASLRQNRTVYRESAAQL
jgi:hypothetical protein